MLEFVAHMSPISNTRKPLVEGPFDLLVVGGGINGTGIARDAALRGMSVVLLEKHDFAEGTSSRSSKMVHGGIRYLEQLRIGLVYEALRERHYLLKLAPHLVRPQAFVLPIYQGDRRGPRTIRLGLFLYDRLALGRRPGKCRMLSAREVIARVPALKPEGLLGGGLYYDAVMDDARLVLANVLAAREAAAGGSGDVALRNYTEVVSIEPGCPSRITARDLVTARTYRILAHHVVKALGPWTDRGRLVPSKGSHVILPQLPLRDGLLLTHSRDGRVFFLVPWLGRTVVGTTETPFNGSPDDLRVEPDEVAYLMEEVRRLFPGVRISSTDILGTFAGIRPLARETGLWGRTSPGTVSRVHKIVIDAEGVLSVFGGKYTTYRAVAEEVVDRIFPGTRSTTSRKPLPGGEAGTWPEYQRLLQPALRKWPLAEIERLFYRYGARLGEVLLLADSHPELKERLSPAHAEIRAEVVHCIRNEFVVYPEDFLTRRTSLRYTLDGGRSAYDAVEQILRENTAVVPPDLDVARRRYFEALGWEDSLRSNVGQAISS